MRAYIPRRSFKMTLSLLASVLRTLSPRWPQLVYAAAWTTLLTATAAAASLSPELAFVSFISPASFFSWACQAEGGLVRVPFDLPSEVLCVPARLFLRSNTDLFVPPRLCGRRRRRVGLLGQIYRPVGGG